ncbi:MAG: excinuclease ABC subunit UvrC [Acidobacteriota bacterium]
MKVSLGKVVRKLPNKPGVYIFKNKREEIIYIGKAKSLKDRVKSYFTLYRSDKRSSFILDEIDDVNYVVTDSERDAFFLENNLVREHQPKFNVKLKDDKSYPYIKMTYQEDFPGAYYVRKVEDDGSIYFGPFAPASTAKNTMRILSKWFKVRQCDEKIDFKRKRPCLDYFVSQCSAPCTGFISRDEYRETIEEALLFLKGRDQELIKILKEKMENFASEEKFERAAQLRDLIFAVESLKRRPLFSSTELEDQDIFGYYREDGYVSLILFLMRKGKIVDRKEFIFENIAAENDPEIISSFVIQFYREFMNFPEKILLPFYPENLSYIKDFLKEIFHRNVEIIIPRSGNKLNMIKIANQNARISLENKFLLTGKDNLEEVKKIVGISKIPLRIEGFDVSHISGKETVGSMVSFFEGEPDKKNYRKFIIKYVEGIDDFYSIYEIVKRRYKRLIDENAKFPDLVVIDGGKAQLNAAKKALKELGIEDIPVISIAKGEEIIYSDLKKDGIKLESISNFLKLIQRVRDEAHRFAVTFHRKRREK